MRVETSDFKRERCGSHDENGSMENELFSYQSCSAVGRTMSRVPFSCMPPVAVAV